MTSHLLSLKRQRNSPANDRARERVSHSVVRRSAATTFAHRIAFPDHQRPPGNLAENILVPLLFNENAKKPAISNCFPLRVQQVIPKKI
jgi:hypothetical protein